MICQVHDMSFVVKSKFKHAVSCKPIVSGLKVPEEEIRCVFDDN